MTHEFIKVELTNEDGYPRRFTCASGVAITKGTLLKLATPNTASAQDGAEDYIAGIASMDKAANDRSTSITAWTDGIFIAESSGTIIAGEPVSSDAADNHVIAATGGASGANVIGYALDGASTNETLKIRVRL